ncbi:MAG: M48 family metallopeptidase, partial [Bacteroidota bacterium]
MNIYGIIILATLIISFILETVADVFNLKNLKEPLPAEFEGIYGEDEYLKSQLYTSTGTKFGLISSSFSLVIMLVFWLFGGFNYIDLLVLNLTGSQNIIINGVIYIGILIIANSIISLPFSIYSTFVIESEFGFNKTTPKTFILDLLKSLLLFVIIFVPVLALILYLLDSGIQYAWLYGWVILTLISLIIQFIAPRWILPLFNKFTLLEDGELKTAIQNYAKSVNYPVKNIFVIDGSKRSSKSNAFFTGFGKFKRIALFDTLIEKHTTD